MLSKERMEASALVSRAVTPVGHHFKPAMILVSEPQRSRLRSLLAIVLARSGDVDAPGIDLGATGRAAAY